MHHPSDFNTEILQLRSEVRKHNQLYYDLDMPEITDLEYDTLINRLKTLSPNDPIINEMGNSTFGTKVDHSTMMGSLDKVHSLEEIISRFNGMEVCIDKSLSINCSAGISSEKNATPLP